MNRVIAALHRIDPALFRGSASSAHALEAGSKARSVAEAAWAGLAKPGQTPN